jgi:uncharacterized protein YlxW (UPF0749 family)
MKRPRISLRLLLLAVALLATLFAWRGVKQDQERTKLLLEIKDHENMRRYALQQAARTSGAESRGWQKSANQNDAEIESRVKQLGGD